MESQYPLAYDMHVGWPIPLEFLLIRAISYAGKIGTEGIEPDILYLGRIIRDRHSPASGSGIRSGYTEIPQPASYEAEHFVFSCLGDDHQFIAFDQFLELLLVSR